MTQRKKVPVDVKSLVLHERGYRCANPVCRTILTLDIHHLVQVADGGSNEPSNLLPQCPNCHSLHHRGTIPGSSLIAWKHLLLSLNHAFDGRVVDLILTLAKQDRIWVSGDGVLQCAAGIASGLINVVRGFNADVYYVCLSDKGRAFYGAWVEGRESDAVNAIEPTQ